MADKTFTRDDLRDAIQRALPKLSRKEAVRLIEEMLREVDDALVLEGIVCLRTLGSFVVRPKNERMGRNPRTKTSAVIKRARRVVSFKCSPELARRMNGTALEEE
jgi:integration host factor subunit alpha